MYARCTVPSVSTPLASSSVNDVLESVALVTAEHGAEANVDWSVVPPPAPLIAVRGLCKNYRRDLQVLRGVDLNVARGETVALIGANGSGKSTFLKSLVGLHEIDGGTIELLGERFDHRPSTRQKAVIRRSVGFVFQAHSLVRRSSALTNVIHGHFGLRGAWRASSHATAPRAWRTRAMDALDAVGLADKALARADQLSGGQQQRVAIARALVRRPTLLIADEPAASLDPVAGHDVMRQLVALSRTYGSTLVFTSHDMEHAVAYADRIVALKRGRVFIDAPSGTLSLRDIEAVFQ